ncbi:MAG: hypothetical protein EXR84_04565 [Gammaproteobacteria bacterium]|nr:hypothetical protein [Gammaproteobacteria bacterium]
MTSLPHKLLRCSQQLALLTWFGALVACAQPPAPPPERPALAPTAPVALQLASASLPTSALLDIGVAVFTSTVNAEQTSDANAWLFAEISRKETQYLPYVLRNTLIASNQWGAVRVLPENDPSVDLLVHGTIFQSDGEVLDLAIRATDSTGREWLNKRYMEVAAMSDYPDTTRFTPGRRFDANNFIDPFQDVYDLIANDLQAARNAIDAGALAEIQLVAEMLYANDIAPDAFAHTLQINADGTRSVASLPADDDPMRKRIEEIRLRHYLFIDTVDDYYRALYDEMQPAYVLWRRFSLEQIQIETSDRLREFEPANYSDSNNYLSLTQRYDRYKWSKIYEQEFTELASGFNNEIAPAILELNQQVHGLSGSMESQYRQWRGILQDIFSLETGSAPASR